MSLALVLALAWIAPDPLPSEAEAANALLVAIRNVEAKEKPGHRAPPFLTHP